MFIQDTPGAEDPRAREREGRGTRGPARTGGPSRRRLRQIYVGGREAGHPVMSQRSAIRRIDAFVDVRQSSGTTSAASRSIWAMSSTRGLRRISSAPALATSRRPVTHAAGGPASATADQPPRP